mgnify:CR=1 FL=1
MVFICFFHVLLQWFYLIMQIKELTYTGSCHPPPRYGGPPAFAGVHYQHAEVTPSQTLPYIGAIPDTVQFHAYPLERRVKDIRVLILMFQPQSRISVRLTVTLLGLMASCIILVKHARWYMRALQWDLKFLWQQHQGNLSDHVQISEQTAKDLQLWLLNQDWPSDRALSLSHSDLTVVTDASLLG